MLHKSSVFRMIKTFFPSIIEFLNEIIWAIIKSNDSRIGQILRQRFYKTKCIIDTDVVIKNRTNFHVGKHSAIYHASYILNTFGKFHMGDNSHLGAFCYVNVCQGNLIIGKNVAIGPGSKIFVYSNHYEKNKKITETKITQDVQIGNNVFIGANCVILPGTKISDNVVIGASSLVRGILEGNAIYAGNPCRQIRKGWDK
jgi:carbonic anhydrase/acetyltransferase-like protein (isoleucine patch superfamily)